MKCTCGNSTNVTDARYIPEGYWRKRKCLGCGAVMTTVEQRCETISGSKGRQPVYTVPKPKAVKAPSARVARKTHAPALSKQAPKERVVPTRSRIEDLRMELELEKL